MKILKSIIIILFFTVIYSAEAQKILIPMDFAQTDHLKSYGIAYWIIDKGQPVDWLLNYRGGSFMCDYNDIIVAECRIRGVFFETIDGVTAAGIYSQVQSEDYNMDVVKLEKPPKIGVYAPKSILPWDDAVVLALTYAEIPHDIFWDDEVLAGKLNEYDWLHLHHEDFTGQYGKFWANFQNTPWYIQDVQLNEGNARKNGYSKVSKLKLAVALKIRDFVLNGGFLFTMCSAPDSYDVALAAQSTDICQAMFDGDPMAPDAQEKLDFSQTFAFENFKLVTDPYTYEISSIDTGPTTISNPDADYFTLFEFSAKWDPVPTMLTQCHVNVIKGFLGQTTAFKKEYIKKSVTIMAERDGTDEVRYIHGNVGKGTYTFYGGHDPEDYQHLVGDPPTELKLHKNSPGYRLILNNVLFPAAKKKKQKT
ncbi:MAG TPA: asparagine synthetase B [Candidatus Kapabacteria bacterium]|nr:asparagine synthetase B [Candidatus Kapabacteria bacterium]